MQTSSPTRRSWWGGARPTLPIWHGLRRALLLACLLLCAAAASAAEPWRPFLEGLRDRGFYDMALVYLDRMAADPRCPADLAEVVDYEAGLTLMLSSRAARFVSVGERDLDDARARFEKFLAEHPSHAMATLAASQLANVLVERGRLRADRAAQPSVPPGQREQLLAEARGFYTKAHEAFVQAGKRYEAEAKSSPGSAAPADDAEKERREQLLGNLLQTRLFAATALYEIGRTYPADAPERKQKLTEAAADCNKLYEEYVVSKERPRVVGLHARLLEGCCYEQLGDYKKALSIYGGVLKRLDESPAGHELANRTLVAMLGALVKPDVKGYKSAIEQYTAWEARARGTDASSVEGLAIRYFAAQAYLEHARSLDKGDAAREEQLAAARQLFRQVSRFPGEHQAEAKTRQLDPLFGRPPASVAEPADFAAARDRAEAARDQVQAAELQARLDRAEGKPAGRAPGADEIAESRAEAIRYYRLAIALATPETPLAELNLVRCSLAELYLRGQDRYEAAVLGEFLARRHADDPLAPRAAIIAMVAYGELLGASPAGPTKEFARERLLAITDYIAHRWPAAPEAADAWLTLIHTAVVNGDLTAAVAYLDKLPAASPRRGEAEMMLGRACWSQWIRAGRLDQAHRPDAKTLAEMLSRAKGLLAAGLAKVASEGRFDASFVAAQLALAQIHLDEQKPEEAVRLLDDAATGAVALARAKHDATSRPGYRVEIYKTALRAYVAARQLDRALAVMGELEKAVAAENDAQSVARVTEIYLALTRQLQDSLESLRQQGRTEELASASRGFESFLERIARQKEGNTFSSLAWVAATLSDMGSRLDPGGKTPPPEAAQYYRKAAEVYATLLARSVKEPRFAPDPTALDAVRVRQARCLRRLGKYNEALNLLIDVLANRNRMVDGQIEAAYVYQDWAATPGNAKKYLDAIQGACRARRADGSQVNVVWGWGKLANLVFRSESRLATFHEARWNLARCRFDYASTLSGEAKKSMLAQAEKDIVVTQVLSPTLGGPAWRGQYDELLKRIQSALGKPPVGLGADIDSKPK